ncbi:hypothetical protein P7K49_012874, partial [Saguinus oedipus]
MAPRGPGYEIKGISLGHVLCVRAVPALLSTHGGSAQCSSKTCSLLVPLGHLSHCRTKCLFPKRDSPTLKPLQTPSSLCSCQLSVLPPIQAVALIGIGNPCLRKYPLNHSTNGVCCPLTEEPMDPKEQWEYAKGTPVCPSRCPAQELLGGPWWSKALPELARLPAWLFHTVLTCELLNPGVSIFTHHRLCVLN